MALIASVAIKAHLNAILRAVGLAPQPSRWLGLGTSLPLESLMTQLQSLQTPCLILDSTKLTRNVARMARHCAGLGVALWPHIKTPKSLDIAGLLRDAGAEGFTVSTLQEAEYLHGAGFDDTFYAVPLDPNKVPRVAALLRSGARLSILINDIAALRIIGERAATEAVVLQVWIEIDVDGYRTGIPAGSAAFEELVAAAINHPALTLKGIMSYGGASYGCASKADVAALTERHRLALIAARDRVARDHGQMPLLSFGSTPAVLHATGLDGIDQVRCGIYTFQDLFQAGIGACDLDDLALSVLTTVISHSPELDRFTIDAGGLALSKDRSTQGHPFDAGYGLVCDLQGRMLPGLTVSQVSQELGLVTSVEGRIALADFPVGSRLRILPNHADMTAAAYEEYHLVGRPEGGDIVWRRTNRW